jgi:hypothetical protein
VPQNLISEFSSICSSRNAHQIPNRGVGRAFTHWTLLDTGSSATSCRLVHPCTSTHSVRKEI